ncbi:EamA/RhaT family transporter [Parapedobacter lycopersici]|uniref:EamA/RhaT family transporter n=1 Tax=Parapedobacter lycopersici TaxID=1864939 RepID=UPI003340EEA1
MPMVYVLFSALCSVAVSVILKLARRYSVDSRQLIVWNYPVATGLTWLLLDPVFTGFQPEALPWLLYLVLAFLLPGIFLAIAASIHYTGIVRTEIAQRLSLSIALLAAFWLFGETVDGGKLTGIGLGFAAIACCIGWHKRSRRPGNDTVKAWVYPLVVFFGMGIIDVFFKQVAQHREIPYTTSMLLVFALATLISLGYMVYHTTTGKGRFSVAAVFWGLLLGIFNFGNILLYMRAHRALSENPSVVFSAMNIGVIALGALVGVFVFNEKLSVLNKIGMALAIVAVLVIAYL